MAEVLDNLDVQYTYHVHEGSEGITANGCYTAPVYHAHSNSCYSSCNGSWKYSSSFNEDGETYYRVKCSGCGGADTFIKHEWESGKIYSCRTRILTCNKTGFIENYVLGCGKDETTIESVTILY